MTSLPPVGVQGHSLPDAIFERERGVTGRESASGTSKIAKFGRTTTCAITSNGEEEKEKSNDVYVLRHARSRSDSCNGNYRHTSLSNHVLNLAQSCVFWLFD